MATATVVGAGVVGLTAAILLAEAGHETQVITADDPEHTNSRIAGALVGPIIADRTESRALRWVRTGDKVFRALARIPETGARVVTARLFGDWDTAGEIVQTAGHRPCTPAEQPSTSPAGCVVEVVSVDMRRYLRYLHHRALSANVTIERRRLGDLTEAAPRGAVILNCTGGQAPSLTADTELVNRFGQHVIVANPGLPHQIAHELPALGPGWAAYFVHDDRVVLGGVAHPGHPLVVDDDITAGILARVAAMEPALAEPDVLGVEVGYRPWRPTVRVERELLDGRSVVHCYGHGGNGVQWSWGSAADAIELALAP